MNVPPEARTVNVFAAGEVTSALVESPQTNDPSNVAFARLPAAKLHLPLARLKTPPATNDSTPLASFPPPPATVDSSAVAWLLSPPPTVERWALARLLSPPPTVAERAVAL